MDKKHILIADDQESLLIAMKLILKGANYKVTTVADGQAALSFILKTKKLPDLLITDIDMPNLSGLELIDELNRRNISIPILATTAYKNIAVQKKLLHMGCKYYLEKPFGFEELLRHVNMIFEKDITNLLMKTCL